MYKNLQLYKYMHEIFPYYLCRLFKVQVWGETELNIAIFIQAVTKLQVCTSKLVQSEINKNLLFPIAKWLIECKITENNLKKYFTSWLIHFKLQKSC